MPEPAGRPRCERPSPQSMRPLGRPERTVWAVCGGRRARSRTVSPPAIARGARFRSSCLPAGARQGRPRTPGRQPTPGALHYRFLDRSSGGAGRRAFERGRRCHEGSGRETSALGGRRGGEEAGGSVSPSSASPPLLPRGEGAPSPGMGATQGAPFADDVRRSADPQRMFGERLEGLGAGLPRIPGCLSTAAGDPRGDEGRAAGEARLTESGAPGRCFT